MGSKGAGGAAAPPGAGLLGQEGGMMSFHCEFSSKPLLSLSLDWRERFMTTAPNTSPSSHELKPRSPRPTWICWELNDYNMKQACALSML